MDSVLAYLSLFFCGVGSFVLLALWRAARVRWEEGSTLFKKLTKPLLVLATLGLVIYTLSATQAEGLVSGLALMSYLAGVAVPWYLQRKGQATEAAAPASSGNAEVLDAKRLAKLVKGAKASSQLQLSGVPVPVAAETTHFLVLGASAKDRAATLGSLLDQVRDRGDTAIVLDAAGTVLSRHFDADTDFVLNPFDERCVSWSPVHECADEAQAAAMVRCMLPADEVSTAAQTYAGAVLAALGSRSDVTHREFLDMLLEASHDAVAELLDGSPAATVVASEQRLTTLRGELRRCLTALSHLPPAGDSFSVTQMVQAQHSGVLFVTYRDDQLAVSRRALSCVFDAAARAILAGEAQADHRVWFIVDDLASLDQLPSLEDLTLKARRNGAGLVLGAQSLADIRARYGATTTDILLANLASRIVTQGVGPDEAPEAAALLGLSSPALELEVLEPGEPADSKGLFRMSKPTKPAKGAKEKLVKKPAAKPAPKTLDGAALVRGLAEGRMLLKLAGAYPVADVAAPPSPAEARAPASVVRRGSSLPVAKELREQAPVQAESDMPEEVPVVHRRATGPLLDEPVELTPLESVFASEAEALLYRTRKTQEELRKRAAALGISAFDTEATDVEFVERSEEPELPPAASVVGLPPDSLAALQPETPMDEPVAPAEDRLLADGTAGMPVAVDDHPSEPLSPTSSEEPPRAAEAAPVPVVAPAPTPPQRRDPAKRTGKPPRDGRESPPPARTKSDKPAAPKRDAAAGAAKSRSSGPAKGGKAHDMLKDLLR